jgi:NADH:ubiquinone oxidoreductase subunit E
LIQFPEKRKELDAFLDALSVGSSTELNRSYLIKCLHKAQGVFGYLPHELQLYIAERLRLPLANVYGVISFYSFFTTKPPAAIKIHVCTGTACFVKGADALITEFENLLGIKNGGITDDMKFSLGALRCIGACSLAPAVIVNEKVYGNATVKTVRQIISEYSKQQ